MTRPSRLIAGVLVAAAAAAVFSVGAEAYSSYAKWGSAVVSFYVNPTNADLSDSAAESALVRGADVWSSQSNASIRFQYAGRVTDNSTAYDGRNVVMFRNTTSGAAIASTYSWWSGSTLLDSDIIFWDGGFTFFSGSSGCGGSNAAYVEDIAAHEFGHALGLNHSTVTDATMYAGYSTCSQAQRTLSPDDVAGVQALYPPTTSNTAPTVAISSPSAGASVSQGTSTTFSGSASDPQDGSLSSRLAWTSSIDGAIGSGSSFARTLSAGTHVITASVTDSGGLVDSRQVTITVAPSLNTAPTVAISSPSGGTSFAQGTSMTFSGSASDTEDGNLSSRLAWTSSIDGSIGTGSSFARTLSAGTHVITAVVTDSGGFVGSRQITITVTAQPSNTAPTVSIASPSNGASFSQGGTISFSGSASDAQDGSLGSRLTWRSSLDGQIGSGSSFSRSLSAGTHVVTASVTDAGGLSGSAQVTITVTASVASTGTPTLTVRASKVKGTPNADLSWNGLSSAQVDVYREGVKIVTTANDGQYTDTFEARGKVTQTYRVCSEGTSTCTNPVTATF
jgi:hypothetical protein